MGLNGRVRDGNGCNPHAIATNNMSAADRGASRRCGPRAPCDVALSYASVARPCPPSPASTLSSRPTRRATAPVQHKPRVEERESALRWCCRCVAPRYMDVWVCFFCTGVSQATRAISTARLHVLPHFHLPPINVLVSHGPSEVRRPGSTHLRGGFPLRCFQRLSLPDVATRRCPWRNNRYTRGQSIPVLSY